MTTPGFATGNAAPSALGENFASSRADVLSNLVDWNIAYVIRIGLAGSLGGAIGGAAIGFALQRSRLSLTLRRFGAIVLAWAVAWGIPWAIGTIYDKYTDSWELLSLTLVLVISGLISGVIGSFVMFSQLGQAAQKTLGPIEA